MRIALVIIFLVNVCLSTLSMADEKVIVGGDSTAQQYIPVALRLDVSHLGYGGALIWEMQPDLSLIAGYRKNGFLLNHSVKTTSQYFDLIREYDRNFYMYSTWEPWLEHSSTVFKSTYLALGVAYFKQRHILKAQDNQSQGLMRYNQLAPYLGVGIRPMLSLHWEWFAEVGVYYSAQPQVELNQSNVEYRLEKNEIATQNRYRWLPNAQVGIVYRF